MSVGRGKAVTNIRRAIEANAEPRQSTAASGGVAGYTGAAIVGSFIDVNAQIDMRPLITQGYWTEEHGWSLQWMRLISQGYLTE